MATTIQILTTNYSGETATITFSPCSGGTINLGSQVIPYNYVSENYLGDYSLYFSDFDQTCTFTIPCSTPTPTPTGNPTPTPTIVVTATPVPTGTATPTPTATDVPATPTPTATDVPATPTPTATDVPATPTPTATDVPATPTPTPTPTPTKIDNNVTLDIHFGTVVDFPNKFTAKFTMTSEYTVDVTLLNYVFDLTIEDTLNNTYLIDNGTVNISSGNTLGESIFLTNPEFNYVDFVTGSEIRTNENFYPSEESQNYNYIINLGSITYENQPTPTPTPTNEPMPRLGVSADDGNTACDNHLNNSYNVTTESFTYIMGTNLCDSQRVEFSGVDITNLGTPSGYQSHWVSDGTYSRSGWLDSTGVSFSGSTCVLCGSSPATPTPTPTADSYFYYDAERYECLPNGSCNYIETIVIANDIELSQLNRYRLDPESGYILKAINTTTSQISLLTTMSGAGSGSCSTFCTQPTPTPTDVPPTATPVPPTSTPVPDPTPTATPTATPTFPDCVTSVSFDVDSPGDVSYVDCCGNGITVNFGGTGTEVINDCIQYGTLTGTGALISFITYNNTPCICPPTATSTPTPTATDIPPTSTPVPDPTPTSTDVPAPTATEISPTPHITPTVTPTPPPPPPTDTPTPTPTDTPTPTATPTATPVSCECLTVYNEADRNIIFEYVRCSDGNLVSLSVPFGTNRTVCVQEGTDITDTSGLLTSVASGTPCTVNDDCANPPTPTPTATPVPPTATPVPDPTATPVPDPTATPVPPTSTPVPPTATPPPPTATPTATPDQTANWVNSGTYNCYSTCDKYNVEIDNNVNSLSYNQTRQGSLVASNSVDCGGCCGQSTAANWTNEGAAYCTDCVSYQDQRDTNTCSATYNQTRTINSGSACNTSQTWVNSGSYDCYGTCNKYNVEIQNNPCASGYNTTRQGSLVESNSTFCYVEGTNCCGQSTAAVWFANGQTTCVGVDNYLVEEDMNPCSPTAGQTRTGNLLEANSVDCGYTPPPTPTPSPMPVVAVISGVTVQNQTSGECFNDPNNYETTEFWSADFTSAATGNGYVLLTFYDESTLSLTFSTGDLFATSTKSCGCINYCSSLVSSEVIAT